MTYVDKCDKYFIDDNSTDPTLKEEYIDIRFKVCSIMFISEIDRFFELLYLFSDRNKIDFIHNLYSAVCSHTDIEWMIFINESLEEDCISAEILDLIEGWLCTSEVSSTLRDHERSRWQLKPIDIE